MIDEWNQDRSGWARFSADKSKRYRLARGLTPNGCADLATRRVHLQERGHSTASGVIFTAVFVMLNPSTADAFKLDPTVTRCVKFAQRWGADVLEVVNLFALRSPYPEDLYTGAKAAADIGSDMANDDAIRAACDGAQRVIAAWGRHGRLNHRAEHVTELLTHGGVMLEALRTTPDGVPMHPLARGKAFISYETEPKLWP